MANKEVGRVCLDTNVLLDASDEGRDKHLLVFSLINQAIEQHCPLILPAQVVREYMVAATRPVENNGLGMHLSDVLENVRRFTEVTQMALETQDAVSLFRDWVAKYKIKGTRLHDLQLLATAKKADADTLVTSNVKDFPKDTGVRIITPEKLKGLFN